MCNLTHEINAVAVTKLMQECKIGYYEPYDIFSGIQEQPYCSGSVAARSPTTIISLPAQSMTRNTSLWDWTLTKITSLLAARSTTRISSVDQPVVSSTGNIITALFYGRSSSRPKPRHDVRKKRKPSRYDD